MNRFFIIVILVISFLLILNRLFFKVNKNNTSSQIKSYFKIGREIEKSTDTILKTGVYNTYPFENNQTNDLTKGQTDIAANEKVKFIKMNLEPANISPPSEIINLKPNPE